MFVGVDAITFRCCCNIKWDINSKLHIPSHLCDFTHHFFFSRYFVDLFIIIVSFVTRAPCYNLQWIYDESWCSVIWSMQPLIDFIEFLMASDFFFRSTFLLQFPHRTHCTGHKNRFVSFKHVDLLLQLYNNSVKTHVFFPVLFSCINNQVERFYAVPNFCCCCCFRWTDENHLLIDLCQSFCRMRAKHSFILFISLPLHSAFYIHVSWFAWLITSI